MHRVPWRAGNEFVSVQGKTAQFNLTQIAAPNHFERRIFEDVTSRPRTVSTQFEQCHVHAGQRAGPSEVSRSI